MELVIRTTHPRRHALEPILTCGPYISPETPCTAASNPTQTGGTPSPTNHRHQHQTGAISHLHAALGRHERHRNGRRSEQHQRDSDYRAAVPRCRPLKGRSALLH